MLDQIKEMDYNATSKLKAATRRISEIGLIRPHFEEFDKANKFSATLEEYFKDHVSKLKEQSKKIKKTKNLEKRKKLYEIEKQERMTNIDKTNALFAEDDMLMKSELAKSENLSLTQK